MKLFLLIQKLIQKGFAYESGGEYLFAVEKYKNYGTLSNRKLEDMIAGKRVAVQENKKKNHTILYYGRM